MPYDKCIVCDSPLGTAVEKEEEAFCYNCYHDVDISG